MSERLLPTTDGFGLTQRDLSVQALWSRTYAPPFNGRGRSALTREVVTVTEGPGSLQTLDPTIDLSILQVDGPVKDFYWAVPIETTGGWFSSRGGNTVVQPSDGGYIFLCNIYQTATFYNAVTPTVPVSTLTGNNQVDVMVKYDAGGNLLWRSKTECTGPSYRPDMYGGSLALDAESNIVSLEMYFGGTNNTVSAYDAMDLLVTSMTVTEPFSAFATCLTKRDPQGTPVWMVQLSGVFNALYPSRVVTLGPYIYVLVASVRDAKIYDASNPLTPHFTVPNISTLGNDAILVQYDAQGTAQWYMQMGGPFDEQPMDLVQDGHSVYCVVNPQGTMMVKSSDGSTFGTYTAVGNRDAVVVKIASTGMVQWVSQLSTSPGKAVSFTSLRCYNNTLYAGVQYEDTVTDALGTVWTSPAPVTGAGLVTFDPSSGQRLSATSLAKGSFNFGLTVDADAGGLYFNAIFQDTMNVYHRDNSLYTTVTSAEPGRWTMAQVIYTSQGQGRGISTLGGPGQDVYPYGKNYMGTTARGQVVIGCSAGCNPLTITEMGSLAPGPPVTTFSNPAQVNNPLLVVYNPSVRSIQLPTPPHPMTKYLSTGAVVYPLLVNLESPLNYGGSSHTQFVLLNETSRVNLYWNGHSWDILSLHAIYVI